MERPKPFILPFLLFILAFVIRSSLISKGPYHPDCLNLALTAEKILETGRIHYLQGSGLPLTALLGAVSVWLGRLAGITDPVTAVNLMSVAVSALGVAVFFKLLERWTNRTSALIASLLLTVNPIFLGVSVYGNSHPPAIFFLLLALFFLEKYFSQQKIFCLIIGAVSMALMGAARLHEFVVMMIPVCYLLTVRHSCPWRDLGLFLITILLVILPFYLPLLTEVGAGDLVGQSFGMVRYHIFEWFPGLFSRALKISLYFLMTSLSPVGFILSLAGAWHLYKNNHRLAVFCLLWLLFPLFLFGNLTYIVPRLILLCVIPLIISLACLLSNLFEKNVRLKVPAILLFALIMFLNFTRIAPLLDFRHRHALLVDYYRWLSTVTEPDAYIIDRDHSLFVQHYSRRTPMTPPAFSTTPDPEQMAKFKQRLDRLLDQENPVYITEEGIYGYLPQLKVKEFFLRNYDFGYVGRAWTDHWQYGVLSGRIYPQALFRMTKPPARPKMEQMTDRSKNIVLPLALFLLAFALRLLLISKGPYHPDCLVLAVTAQENLDTLRLHYLQGSGLPLSGILGAAAILLAENLAGITDPVTAVNLMSAVLSSLCVVLIYYLALLLFDRRAAVVSALVFCVNPVFLAVSVFGNSHTPSLFFFLSGLVLLSVRRQGQAGLSVLIGAALCFGLMGACRVQDLAAVIVPVWFYLFCGPAGERKATRTRWRDLLLFSVVIACVTALFYVPMVLDQSVKMQAQRSFGEDIRYQVLQSFKGIFTEELYRVFYQFTENNTLLAVLMAATGFSLIFRQRRDAGLFLLLLFLIPLLLLGNLVYSTPRLLLPAIVPFSIAVGYAVRSALQKGKMFKWTGVLLLLVLLALNLGRALPLLTFRHDHALLPDFFRWIARNTEENALVLDRDHSLFLKYYSGRRPLGTPIDLHGTSRARVEKFARQVKGYLEEGIPVYITDAGLTGYPPPYNNFYKFVLKHFQLEYIGEHPIEDWHNGLMTRRIAPIMLFRIREPEYDCKRCIDE